MLPSALKAGYSESYARRNSRNILKTAIKEQARSIIEQTDSKEISTKDIKQLMSDIVGMTREDMFARLRYIALENKDVATGLKILAPLVKEHGVILSSDDDKQTVNVPILNLSFGSQNTAKNIEPVKDNEITEDEKSTR